MNAVYRTLVRGRLKQLSSLLVGGSVPRLGGADIQCARDGLGRLTIPGTGLAGCFIDTAGRIFPQLFESGSGGFWRRITSKQKGAPPERTLQSLWRFWPSHRTSEWVEWRQGVGIRQATGATAGEAGALYDLETIPPGETWQLFLEVDTLRGGPEVERIALLALCEWAAGRCWLGAGAARGLGWMELTDFEVLRLPATEEALRAWPDSSRPLDDALWQALPGQRLTGKQVRQAAEQAVTPALAHDRFWYVQIEGTVGAGNRPDGYGLDALSAGGHAAGLIKPLADRLLSPRGLEARSFRTDYEPDHPIVTSGADDRTQKPLLPGSSLRGPLRHAASRHRRSTSGDDVPDPNERRHGKPPEEAGDIVSALFGLTKHSACLLVSDARLREGEDYLLALLQHHAEDEFAGSVFGSGKFDRTVLLQARFPFRLVVEAKTQEEMQRHLEALRPALRLAELGFVAVGGAKTRGAGGAPWIFGSVSVGRAGEAVEPQALEGVSVLDGLRIELERRTGGGQ